MDNPLTVGLSLEGWLAEARELPSPRPWRWTEHEAEQFLAAIYAALKPHAL